ncbi:unnamed protein product [Schistosoma turkestanicum]|nr:unnamed protein product [Schistosoma turkestanicum]
MDNDHRTQRSYVSFKTRNRENFSKLADFSLQSISKVFLASYYSQNLSFKSQTVGNNMERRFFPADQPLTTLIEQKTPTSKGLNEERRLDHLTPDYSNIDQSVNNQFNVKPSRNSVFQPINNNHLSRNLPMIHSKEENVKYSNGNILRNKTSPMKYVPSEDKPPPRPPRNPHVLHTVKEHVNMRDDEIVETKVLANVKHRYPVTGLAKRMSIAASDLLGKSRDDLILLLLQLNREKANLKRWYEYFTYQIDQIRLVKGNTNESKSDIAVIQSELNDVISQLKLSDPLIKFLDNMIRMGDVYGGDDVLFASEYRRHLLPSHEIVPSNPSLEFARDIEEREIARVLNNSLRHHSLHRSSPLLDENGSSQPATPVSLSPTSPQSASPFNNNDDFINNNTLSILPKLDNMPEPVEIRLQRKRLEKELANIENLCAPHQLIHRKLKNTQKSFRLTERSNKLLTDQSNKFNSKAPSATLLRRLHQHDGVLHQRQSTQSANNNNNSLRHKFTESNYSNIYVGVTNKRPSTAFDHYSQASIKHKHHRDQARLMMMTDNDHGDDSDNEVVVGEEEDENGIKKFQSIPEDLNLFPHDSLFMQNTTIKPSLQDERHKPLNFHDPSDLIQKSSIRSRSYSEKMLSPTRVLATSPTRTTTTITALRKSFELPSRYSHADDADADDRNERDHHGLSRKQPFQEYYSNEMNKIDQWNNSHSSERKTLNPLKTSHDLDNRQFKSNIFSTEHSKLSSTLDSNDLKYANYNYNIHRNFDDLLENIDFATDQDHDRNRNHDISKMKLNRNEFGRDEAYKDPFIDQTVTIGKSSSNKPSSSPLSTTHAQYDDAMYANLSQNYSGTSIQKTELFHETQPHSDYHLPMNYQSDYSHYDYNAKKRDTIISNSSSILEQNKIRPIKNCLLPSQTNTATNKSRLNVYNSPKQPILTVSLSFQQLFLI